MSTWSNELPAEPGFYWIAELGYPRAVVRVTLGHSAGYEYAGSDLLFLLSEVSPGTRWARIDPPAEAVD